MVSKYMLPIQIRYNLISLLTTSTDLFSASLFIHTENKTHSRHVVLTLLVLIILFHGVELVRVLTSAIVALVFS